MNIVRARSFWNNLNDQVCSEAKIFESQIIKKSLGARKPKLPIN